MDMKYLITLPLIAFALAGAVQAEPKTRTSTFDGPNASSTKTTVHDKEAGTFTSDRDITRKSDGATASVNRERQRTENGVSGSGSATGFNGKSASYEYDRTRTDSGFATTGTATDRKGRSYEYDAYGRKTDTGREASRTVNRDGAQIYNRTDNVTHSGGTVSRNTNVTRDSSFKPCAGRRGRGN
jgi:hypothetical protein